MSFSDLFPLTGTWWIDLGLFVLVAITLLYLARTTAHEIFTGLARTLAGGLRVAQRALESWSRQLLRAADSATLLTLSEHQQRLGIRELTQLRQEIHTALQDFPKLRRNLVDRIEDIEQHYRAGPEIPTPPESWGELIERVAGIRQHADPALEDTLAAIQASIEGIGERLSEQYRERNASAGKRLDALRPNWERIGTTLTRLDDGMTALSSRIDSAIRRIRRFETLRNQRRTSLQRFRGWLALNFGVSTFLLGVGILIGLVNFHLTLIPLQETFGTTARMGPFPMSPVVALTLTAAQLGLALLISDTSGLTRLLPVADRLGPGRRRWLFSFSLLLLVLLAVTGAGLAFMRDSITIEAEWLARELQQGIATGEPGLRLVPSLAHMAMGFVLPLTFIALAPALESFFQTGRVAVLLLASLITAVTATGLRLLARLISSAGHLLAYGYDLLIVVPLSLEHRFRRREPSLDEEGRS